MGGRVAHWRGSSAQARVLAAVRPLPTARTAAKSPTSAVNRSVATRAEVAAIVLLSPPRSPVAVPHGALFWPGFRVVGPHALDRDRCGPLAPRDPGWPGNRARAPLQPDR